MTEKKHKQEAIHESGMRLGEIVCTFLYMSVFGVFKYLPSPWGDILRWLTAKIFGLRGGFGWIREGVTIHQPWRVTMGKGWTLNEGVILIPGGRIRIGDHTRVAPRAVIIATNHRYDRVDIPIKMQGFVNADTTIGQDVWIGAHAVILAGTTIGDSAIVAASAVVNQHVDPRRIVGGVPAKPIGWRGHPPQS